MTTTCEAHLGNPIDRRGVLLLAAIAALGPPCPASAAQSEADSALGALLDDYVLYAFERHPESVTMLGLDRGPFAQARSRLDDRSMDQLQHDREILSTQRRQLDAIDRAR